MKTQSPIGKTIASIAQTYDGGQLHDVEIKFTNGTYLSIMNILRPDVKMTYVYGDGDDDRVVVKVRKTRDGLSARLRERRNRDE
jgi:hypothetical protein